MPVEATSFILRFRDLVTGTHETIERHNQIARDCGYVWWGWWSKSGERPAAHTFAAVLTAASDALPILLLDSGTATLYRATCKAVRYDLAKRIESPEKDKTPAYYRDEKYFAWFQLRDFEKVETSQTGTALNALTYVQVDEFFEDSPSPFAPFYGKRIYGASELIQQNRTIWFTRPTRVGDPLHEIELLNAEHVRPHHFTRFHFTTSSRTLLWVSDLHFATDGQHHAFPDNASEQDKSLWLALETALRDAGVDRLAGVIASGDITWRSDPAEFALARTAFFDRVISTYKLDPRQIAVVPGNHDMAFSETPAEKGAAITRTSPESAASYAAFYEGLFRIAPNEFFSAGRRLLIGGALPVDIACLNSSLLQQHPDFRREESGVSSPVFQGQGFIGARQLEDATQQLKWGNEPYSLLRPLRVVVLHHHVVPVTEAEKAIAGGNYSMVLDAERLARWLVRHRVDLVLHGHQHQPFSVSISRTELLEHDHEDTHTFRVLGMGSTGVCASHLGAVMKNTFGLLEFAEQGINVKFFSLHRSDRATLLYKFIVPYRQGPRAS